LENLGRSRSTSSHQTARQQSPLRVGHNLNIVNTYLMSNIFNTEAIPDGSGGHR
jgi:hypothetical protein